MSPEDAAFLEELEKACFLFFWEQASPDTGLVKDRCSVRATDNGVVASIAATGFGLCALCIGQQNGWIGMPSSWTNELTMPCWANSIDQISEITVHDVTTGRKNAVRSTVRPGSASFMAMAMSSGRTVSPITTKTA